MIRIVLLGASMFALVAATVPSAAAAQPAKSSQASSKRSAETGDDDCERRMQKLDASDAEGEERLAAKYDVIAFCARQYAGDTTVKKLVMDCAKYAEQPVLKQQFLAECQLAAFAYANALRTLKMEYRK